VKIFTRYILRECLTYFGVILLAFTGILLTIRMLRFASLIINKGVEVEQIALVFVSIIPSFLEIALPLAVLLGVMLAFARFSGDSEIVVIRASGISITQLIKPVIVFGLIFWGVSLYISLELRPWGFKTLSQSLFEIARSRSTAGLTEGVFNKLGDLTLYAEKIDFSNGALTHVLIDDRRDKNARKVIAATSGVLVSDQTSQLIVLDLARGTIHEQAPERYSLTRFVNNRFVIDPNQVLGGKDGDTDKRANELTLTEIRELRGRLQVMKGEAEAPRADPVEAAAEQIAQNNGGAPPPPTLTPKQLERKINRLDIEVTRRFSMPFAAFILALVGMPLGVQPPRSQKTWGAGISAILGLLVFVIYYGFLSIGITLAENGALPAAVALWIPNLAALGLAFFTLHRIGGERWHSIAHGFEPLLNFGRKLRQRRDRRALA
jgi:lipopolysaccharide export system permease protein